MPLQSLLGNMFVHVPYVSKTNAFSPCFHALANFVTITRNIKPNYWRECI